MRHIAIGLSLFLASSLGAQTSLFFPDNSSSTGTCNVIPFGTSTTSTTWRNQKYQALLTKTQLGSVPLQIQDLGFAGCAGGIHHFDTIQITMGYTTSTTLSTTFASNLTKSQVVLSAKDYDWHQAKDKWSRIGLQKPFLWIPALGNLVVDIEVTGTGLIKVVSSGTGFHRGTLPRMYAYGWTTTPPATGTAGAAALKIELVTSAADLNHFGQGCKGSNGEPEMSLGGSAQLGGKVSVGLVNGPKSSGAALFLGLSNGAPLPVDLAVAGAKGCKLYVTTDIVFGAATDASGMATATLPIPKDTTLIGGRFYLQWFPLDKAANGLGWTASSYGRVLMGN
jgi:hypothetical protein